MILDRKRKRIDILILSFSTLNCTSSYIFMSLYMMYARKNERFRRERLTRLQFLPLRVEKERERERRIEIIAYRRACNVHTLSSRTRVSAVLCALGHLPETNSIAVTGIRPFGLCSAKNLLPGRPSLLYRASYNVNLARRVYIYI